MTETTPSPLRIEDYALIGDCETAALVGLNGSIDWLCLPRFDSGACFAALLGTRDHGYWRIAPAAEIRRTTRHYRPGTLLLETDFETADGRVTLLDCMPLRDVHPHVVRIVVGRSGSVRMRMDLAVRFDYGLTVPWVRKAEGGLRMIAGPNALVLHSPVETRGEDMTTVAEFTVREGERVPFSLRWHPSTDDSPQQCDCEALVAATDAWWRDWSGRCKYAGPWHEAVVRSLVTLRALLYDPTGGMVAAPTTSLPEFIGGVRNWDYRYCWLRDATLTLLALLMGGYVDEAVAWRNWLLRAIAGSPAQLQILYSVTGERRLTESTLSWLPGYAGSAPVRVGNAASQQFQLDVYGEVLDLLYQCRRHGIKGDGDSWQVERAILDFLETAWHKPDDGLWEVRGPRQHFTHSKMMAWVAFDRAIRTVEQFGATGPVDRWRSVRNEIHAEICQRGFSAKLGSFTQTYDADHLDASLLMMPLVGFLPSSDPRVRGTVAAIERGLMHDGFVKRYHTKSTIDGLPPGEGTFLPCSLWLVDALAVTGRADEAAQLYERLLAIRNDLGLISEEYDPAAKRLVGNFPQAFTHVGLIAAAYYLADPDSPERNMRR